MPSITSRLGLERERQLKKLFTEPVHFCLLYKGSRHTFDYNSLHSKCENERIIFTVYLQSGAVRGGYLSKPFPKSGKCYKDSDAFLFTVNEQNATRFPVKDGEKAFSYSYCNMSFGKCLQLTWNNRMFITSKCDDIYGEIWTEEQLSYVEVEVHRVQEAGDVLPSPWREMTWTELSKEELRENLVSFKPTYADLTKVRILLLGPVGAGKSSFINSIISVMYRRVAHMPIIGSAPEGFTKKLRSYDIRAEKGGQPTALTLCDVTGFGDSEWNGLSLHNALEVVKGHIPDGQRLQGRANINHTTAGCRLSPAVKDKIHCVALVLDACKVLFYSKSMEKALKGLISELSDLEIPHVVLLTHVDQVCHAVSEDVQYVYTSRIVLERVEKAAELVGLPVSSVLPVKNYSSEHSVNCNTDILLLSAVNRMLQAADDTLELYPPSLQEA